MIMTQKTNVVTEQVCTATKVQSTVVTTKAIKVPPFGSVNAKGINKIKGHTKHLHLGVEPLEKGFPDSVVTTNSFTGIKPGLNRVGMCLWNLTGREIEISAHTTIAQVQTANVAPQMLAPEVMDGMSTSPERNQSQAASAQAGLDKSNMTCGHLKTQITEPSKMKPGYSILDKTDPTQL